LSTSIHHEGHATHAIAARRRTIFTCGVEQGERTIAQPGRSTCREPSERRL
jgi:hypothetical protein